MLPRFDALKKLLSTHSLDALLISNFYNILYLTGFKGLSQTEREAWCLVTKNNTFLFTDNRYTHQSTSVTTRYITPEKNIVQHLSEIAKDEALKKIGCEADDLTLAEYTRFSKALTLTSTEQIVLKIRAQKNSDEIIATKTACRIADQCLRDIIKLIKPGITERELALKIEWWLREKGSAPAFDPIVAVDKNAAIPHYDTKSNGGVKIKKGSVVLVDFGATHNNYRSDMTRMIFVGKPKDEIAKTYEALRAAQQEGLDALSKTSDPRLVDLEVRNLLKRHKLPNFPHSTGHGVGLDIHELPRVSSKSEDSLLKNHIFTIEPGVYVPGKFGMRLEDTVLMKNDLQPEVLTKFSKAMLII